MRINQVLVEFYSSNRICWLVRHSVGYFHEVINEHAIGYVVGYFHGVSNEHVGYVLTSVMNILLANYLK